MSRQARVQVNAAIAAIADIGHRGSEKVTDSTIGIGPANTRSTFYRGR